MKKISILAIVFMLVCGVASSSLAQMVFSLKYGTDGEYKKSAIVKPGADGSVTVYVSNIPAPGLVSMGFSLEYDHTLLSIYPDGSHIQVDGLWMFRAVNDSDVDSGRVSVTGATLTPAIGDDIPLATFYFTRQAKGYAALTLSRPMAFDAISGQPKIIDGFVMATDDPDSVISLDGEIDAGVVLGYVADEGDYDGDGDIDGADLASLIGKVCPVNCITGELAGFAANFGTSSY